MRTKEITFVGIVYMMLSNILVKAIILKKKIISQKLLKKHCKNGASVFVIYHTMPLTWNGHTLIHIDVEGKIWCFHNKTFFVAWEGRENWTKCEYQTLLT